jgi:beta-lactamase class A
MKTLSPSLVLLACLVTVALPGTVYGQTTPTLPLNVPDTVWHPLREELDPQLQEQLQKAIAGNKKWSALVAKHKMSLSIVDLSDPAAPRFARVNGDDMMYAASLPKIAILLTAMDRMERGELKETPEIIADLNAMIRNSSNGAATRMIDAVGGLPAIEKVLTDPQYGFFDEERGGGLWVGKRYSKSTRRNPDPLQGLSHAATATQVSRFYYLVAEGRLVSRERSAQMLSILSNPGINHKFVNAIRRIAPQARLYRKSGSWRQWHSDSILVWGPERRYIAVCLVDDEAGESIIRNVVPVIDKLLVHPRTKSPGTGKSGAAE